MIEKGCLVVATTVDGSHLFGEVIGSRVTHGPVEWEVRFDDESESRFFPSSALVVHKKKVVSNESVDRVSGIIVGPDGSVFSSRCA